MAGILAKAMRMPKKGKAKRDKRGRKRNYGKEYREYHSKPKQKKRRAGRNAANSKMNPGAGKDTHHKDGNPLNNSPKNLSNVGRSWNRGESN